MKNSSKRGLIREGDHQRHWDWGNVHGNIRHDLQHFRLGSDDKLPRYPCSGRWWLDGGEKSYGTHHAQMRVWIDNDNSTVHWFVCFDAAQTSAECLSKVSVVTLDGVASRTETRVLFQLSRCKLMGHWRKGGVSKINLKVIGKRLEDQRKIDVQFLHVRSGANLPVWIPKKNKKKRRKTTEKILLIWTWKHISAVLSLLSF